MFTHRGLKVDFVPPYIIYCQLIKQSGTHSASRQIHQERVLNLRPLEHLQYHPVDF